MFRKSSLAFALTFCLLPPAAFARQPQAPAQQTPPDDEDDVVRITTNLVQMDAIVTDKQGRRVFLGEPETLEVGRQTDFKRLVASGRLRLGADLTPGEYILQTVVTDALAPEKSRTVSQWLDFEIVR